ncbi:phage tail assembly protein [Novosphingobium sp. FSY-8]|uniref:Phage tail assembly protein n=1 Tax=Novosphingobium ovatum TaxID=1908523 RepID=A0ABW9XAK7_9SPHN|nr:phage tail assembly protein [Novosphingobium ovatum]NBC35535.1 phage tail assembly protein [Novosphingobium ovatum]
MTDTPIPTEPATDASIADAAAPAPRPRTHTIILTDPIQRGSTQITQITLRKPKAFELDGLSMPDIGMMQTKTVIELVTRFSEPTLTKVEARNLDGDDLMECAGAFRDFFMTKAERQAFEAMIAQQMSGI